MMLGMLSVEGAQLTSLIARTEGFETAAWLNTYRLDPTHEPHRPHRGL